MQKYFYRSRTSRMIAGVAGGIAEYFNVDPVLIRAAFIIGIFAGGITFPAYIILWAIMPDETKNFEPITDEKINVNIQYEQQRYYFRKRNNYRILAGIILICIGILILIDKIFNFFDIHDFWPIILIIIGILILIKPH